MSDWGTYDPPCWSSGDHYWHGRSVCSQCGARLRCGCGQFVREDGFDAHEPRCPWLRTLEQEDRRDAEARWP